MTIAFQGMKTCHTQTGNTVTEHKAQKECSFQNKAFESFMTDKVEIKPKEKVTAFPPKIGLPRLLFKRLTKEQVESINNSGKLPQNAKFTETMGQISITWNLADITTGTHELPKGYEVKNDIFGFTHVVREGTKNIFMR